MLAGDECETIFSARLYLYFKSKIRMNAKISFLTPAPWAPGHVINESLYAILKQLGNPSPHQLYLIASRGSVTVPFLHVYSSYLAEHNITTILDPNDTRDLIQSVDFDYVENVMLSHLCMLTADQPGLTNVTPSSPHTSLYSNLAAGKMYEAQVPSSFSFAETNKYNHLFLDAASSFRNFLLPRANLGLIDKMIPGVNDKPIALISIREHSANNQIAFSYADFIPVCAYLKSRGFLIIDVGHQHKSYGTALEKYGVIRYWELPDKNFYTDIDLFSRALLYVGSGGISHLAIALGIPTLWLGCFYPNLSVMRQGFELPCRFYDRRTCSLLNSEQHLEVRLMRRSESSEGFCSWTGEWRPGGSANCLDELQGNYFIRKPMPINIALATKQLLEESYVGTPENIASRHQFLLADISGRPFVSSPISCFL